MDKVKIEKNPSKERLSGLKIESWPTWSCDVSEFDWEYDDKEACYFLEGKVIVKTTLQEVEINKGDLVFFPKGLKCSWNVVKPVKKYYKLG